MRSAGTQGFTRSRVPLIAMLALAATVGIAGCSGSDGKKGATGPTGPAGPTGPTGSTGTVDIIASVNPESCGTCHANVGEAQHQSIYDKYTDASNLIMTFDSVSSAQQANGTYTVTLNFHITKNGAPYVDANGLPTMLQKTFYAVQYDSANRKFINSKSMSASGVVSNGNGTYKLTTTGFAYAPEASNAEVYGYIAQDQLDVETDASVKPSTHYHLYDNMSSAALAFGNVGTYESTADVTACEGCHGKPYRKHGYREAVVAGLPNFAACKTCHYDTRVGSDKVWQQMVDDPLAWATGQAIPADKYNYTANIMNDTHMSHAMEFPYPMTMANCNTCHKGKLDVVLADANFTATTCKSCHPVQAQADYPTEANRAPALEQLWVDSDTKFHYIEMDCQSCHSAGSQVPTAPTFKQLHSGYNKVIYDASGQKYSTLYKATIDSVSIAGNVLDIKFSANTPLITKPTVTVSFYGWDTKDYIISSHTRDGSATPVRMEKTIGTANALFTEVQSGPSSFEVQLDISKYVSTDTDSIPTMIANGQIKKAEILVMPTLVINGTTVALNAPSTTFDLKANVTVDNYFKGTNALVDVAKCNNCHDALATTFHSPDRGGNIVACRTCHVPTSGGSHLEMQSRSIDSYVHAIHKFQAFDPGDIDFSDPVAKKRYELHIEHNFPNFTIKNCEGCHNEGKFNVSDQSKALSALLSASDTFSEERNIGSVPPYVVGPASKACGGCHRAALINEDDAGGLAAFNQHTNAGGYLLNNNDGPYIYPVIFKIMSLFE
jgi:hypothetical protein